MPQLSIGERFPFPIPRELQGILGPNRSADTQATAHQAHCHHFDLNGTVEGVELAGASDFAAGLCVVIASGALPGGS